MKRRSLNEELLNRKLATPTVNLPANLDPEGEANDYESLFAEKRRTKGRVRWFNRSLGYGFILEDSQNEDIYVHFSEIQCPDYRTLRVGQRVVFEYCEGPNGKVARTVVPVFERVINEGESENEVSKESENAEGEMSFAEER